MITSQYLPSSMSNTGTKNNHKGKKQKRNGSKQRCWLLSLFRSCGWLFIVLACLFNDCPPLQLWIYCLSAHRNLLSSNSLTQIITLLTYIVMKQFTLCPRILRRERARATVPPTRLPVDTMAHYSVSK